MASTINADNGVVSGSSGVKTTADTSGVLALQSNGTTGLTLNTSLALGVGSGNSTGTSGQVLTSAGSAAAPTWSTISAGNFGTDLTGTNYTLSLPTTLANTDANPRMQTVALTATTEMMLLYGSSSLQAVVFDNSAGTFGTVVLIRSGVDFNQYNNVACIAISSTQVLVSSLQEGNTALETVVLSVSGSTITVNTAVATTLGQGSSLTTSNNRYVQVGSSFVLHYYRSSTARPAFRAVTISGTTPTLGSEVATSAGTYINSTSYAYSSSILLFIYFNGTGVTALPYTISGTTVTAGTGATRTAESNVMVTGLLNTGRIAILFLNGEGQCGVISVAGTTASISVAATTLTYDGAWAPTMQVYGNQAFVITAPSYGSPDSKLNIITDTSGTSTIGTSADGPGLMVGYLSTGKLFTSSGTSGNSLYRQYGISSNSPVLEKTFSNVSNVNSSTTLSLHGAYTTPYAGPPNSAGGATGLSIRTSAGKTVPLQTSGVPFAISIDGTSFGRYQQGVVFNGSQVTDALSGDIGWSVQQLQTSTTTTLQLIKVKVS
jgi:hypothetical protein